MNRIQDYKILEASLISWLKGYLIDSKQNGYVLGVSGGVDSAVVSTLVAKTGQPVMLLEMPIKQHSTEVTNAKKHIAWLKENFSNVQSKEISLDVSLGVPSDGSGLSVNVFELLIDQINYDLETSVSKEKLKLAEANMRARTRMTMLYHFAGLNGYIVAGTGNKVEDFGIGFFTKYGDGGVDISPIADLYKTEVRKLGEIMGVSDEILQTAPTDGLWDDGRTDEDQIGATYEELEWIMNWIENNPKLRVLDSLTDRQKEVHKIYVQRHSANKHKMDTIPVFPAHKFI